MRTLTASSNQAELGAGARDVGSHLRRAFRPLRHHLDTAQASLIRQLETSTAPRSPFSSEGNGDV